MVDESNFSLITQVMIDFRDLKLDGFSRHKYAKIDI